MILDYCAVRVSNTWVSCRFTFCSNFAALKRGGNRCSELENAPYQYRVKGILKKKLLQCRIGNYFLCIPFSGNGCMTSEDT